MRRDTDPTGAERLSDLRYPRVLLKLSGEPLAGEKGFAWDFAIVERLAEETGDAGGARGGGNPVRAGAGRHRARAPRRRARARPPPRTPAPPPARTTAPG